MGTMCDNFIIYEDNQNEFKMWQGLVGAHYTPYVDGAGNLSWTNNGGLPNPPTVNVTGKGLTITGIVATTGDLPATANQFDTYLVGTAEPYYAYMYYENAWVNIGAIGKGVKGDQGFSPIVTVTPITGGHQISITDEEDTDTFDVMDGADGQDGVGVPSGGQAGAVLKKRSGTSYDTEWATDNTIDPATATPLMDGTAAVGTATKYAREDHVHPTDTSRQETLISGTNIKTINNNSLLGSGDITISGVPSGGTTGQVLQKSSNTDYATEWASKGMTLLWTNPNPTSSFATQTISLDLSGYDFVMVLFTPFVDSDAGLLSSIAPISSAVFNNCNYLFFGWQANNRIGLRKYYPTANGVQFDDCYYNNGKLNDQGVPYQIYGIKI